MPLPKPGKEEEQNAFISRWESAIHQEYPDNEQRTAICYSQWRASKKPKKDSKKRKIIL